MPRSLVLCAFLVYGLASAGCKRPTADKYIPADATARQALETALNAWKDGKTKPEGLTVGKAGLVVLDDSWGAGKKLTAFQIMEEGPVDGRPWFTVKLTLDKGEQTVKYVVVGKDPIWVYSENEFKKASGTS